jgi:Fe-S cluster assembly iron-binding protein IscA
LFSLTPTATTAMLAARSDHGIPDDWGIRFFAPIEGKPDITFDFVEAPEPDDVLGGSGRMRVYVEAAVHRQIGDATVDFKDLDGNAELVIRPYRTVRAS